MEQAGADENAMDIDQDNSAQPEPFQEEVRPVALVHTVNVDVHEVVVGSSGSPDYEEYVAVDDGLVENDVEDGASSTHDVGSASSREPSPVREYEPKEPSRKRSLDDSDDDGILCPICLDNWTNTGEHRICALKCGHLFGYSCVTRWLSQGKKICPTCKKRVGRGDIRYIYAKKLLAVDTSEIDKVKKQMDYVIEERNRAQSDLAKYVCREHLLNQEIAQLKAQLNSLSHKNKVHLNSNSYGGGPSRMDVVRLYMDKSMIICNYGGSRVFDANCRLDMLMASIKSPTSLYNGFGLKKINISTYRSVAFIPVHTLQIRDISFHPENNWVLTASMDKTFKVIDNVSNSVTHHFDHQMPLWSCCWDANNQYVVYVGTQSGIVIKYDLRQLSEPVCYLTIEGDMSPVVSVASIPATPGDILPQGGVVSCKLNSLWIFENHNSQHTRHSLSLEGPFVSMKYQNSTKQLLVSSRPNSRISYSRHTLCTLGKKAEDSIDCNIVHSFQGGGMQKLLSKSCFLSGTNEYVAAHQENCQSVYLWSINTGEKVCSVQAHDTVLDLKGIQNHNGNYLVSLTERKLEFFKFI